MDYLILSKKELAAGCKNSAIFGGYASALKTWADEKLLKERLEKYYDKYAEIKNLSDLYERTAISERKQVLLRIIKILSDLPPTEYFCSPQKTAKEPYKKDPILQLYEIPATAIKKLGQSRYEYLKKLGVFTIEDLLMHFPRDYSDRRQISSIASLTISSEATIKGRVTHVEELRSNNRLSVQKVWLTDETGVIPVIWYNRVYLIKQLRENMELLVFGKTDKRYNQMQFLAKEYEIYTGDNTGWNITPVYPISGSLTQKILRNLITTAYQEYGNQITEILPGFLIARHGFPSRYEAFINMHFPKSFEHQAEARRRFAYEELLILELAVISNNISTGKKRKLRNINTETLTAFKSQLPYVLTNAQEKVIGEIFTDLKSDYPMARLLQGDVGSGKTVVAAAAIYQAVSNGLQCALMIPTEILANQHYQSLNKLLSLLGVRIVLYTGHTPVAERRQILASLISHKVDLIIGTHALIQEDVRFHKLDLVIVDEQHRFGVIQRNKLQLKGDNPDLLVMTATPIPRSLAMALYGDLEISVIDEMPPGRKAVKTYAVTDSYETRIWDFLKKEILSGRQAFIVCPLIEESEKTDFQSAVTLFETLSKKVFPDIQLGLLHGRLKKNDRDALMASFASREVKILVSTTVIEVGLDFPNATIMVIRDAERFGLAQLHQLRGRIGRGSEQSYCILMHHAKSTIAKERMKTMTSTGDGFKIAEADLKLRGPGEFFGIRQHGLPALKVASLLTDYDLLEKARTDARELLNKPDFMQNPAYAKLNYYLLQKEKLF